MPAAFLSQAHGRGHAAQLGLGQGNIEMEAFIAYNFPALAHPASKEVLDDYFGKDDHGKQKPWHFEHTSWGGQHGRNSLSSMVTQRHRAVEAKHAFLTGTQCAETVLHALMTSQQVANRWALSRRTRHVIANGRRRRLPTGRAHFNLCTPAGVENPQNSPPTARYGVTWHVAVGRPPLMTWHVRR